MAATIMPTPAHMTMKPPAPSSRPVTKSPLINPRNMNHGAENTAIPTMVTMPDFDFHG
jgi:hypothetical protein